MQNERKYWFSAKRYGWGWGIPSSWQGWLVLAAFVALLVVGSLLVSAQRKARCLSCLCHRPLRPTCRNVLAERRTDALALGQR